MLFRLASVVVVFAVTSAAADQPPREQFASECDGLVAAAVKTRFGWGWGHVPERRPAVSAPPAVTRSATPAAPESPRGGQRRPAVRPPPEKPLPKGHYNVDMRATAAAGLTLHLAGRELGNTKYTEAALQAARLIVAVQGPKGQVPSVGLLRANAGGRDEPSAVPSRGPTVAALGLLLTILHDDPEGSHEPLRAAALKAVHWLTAQQTRSGGFPVAFPPDAAPDKSSRLIRLDGPEYRDATAALWLAAHVLETHKPAADQKIRRRAEQAVEELLVMRSADAGGVGKGLWTTAYDLDATPLRPVRLREQFPEVVDVQASRKAAHALLAACLMGDAEATAPVLREVQVALVKLPRQGGKWLKRYDPQSPQEKPADAEEDDGGGVFDLSADMVEDEYATGVDGLMIALSQLNGLGPEKYRQALAAQTPIEHRIALLVAGAWEDALTEQAPAGDASDVAEYLKDHKARWPILNGAPPADVFTRVQRLAALTWRSRVGAAKD